MLDRVQVVTMSPKDIKERVKANERAKKTMGMLTRAVAGWGSKVAVFDNKTGEHDIYFVTSDDNLVTSTLRDCVF